MIYLCFLKKQIIEQVQFLDLIILKKQKNRKEMRKFLSKFDLFPASPILRANGESEVVNLCGSIFSICIFSIFAYLFIDSIIKTIQLEAITATEITKVDPTSEKKIGNITIAIGLQMDSLLRVRNILQPRAFLSDQNMDAIEVSTFPCTRQMWKSFNDEQYTNLGLEYAMCIQREGIQIYGSFGGSSMKMLQVGLHNCDNATSPVTCATPNEITDFFATQMIMGRFLGVSVIILDTGLNPTSQNPYAYKAYEKTLWLLCNQRQSIMGQVFFGTYEINTDKNFLPYQDITTEQGYYVSEAITTTMINYLNLPAYVQLFLMASPISKVIDRKYGKVDEVLSYVGGLYGIVISFIGICLLSFNEYKYELRVSQGAFSFRDGHLAKEKDLHFGKYLKYVAFDWIKTFFCCELDWKDCKAIDQARQEANEQIDVKHLLKRISHLEKVLSTLVNEEEEAVMFMAESNSIEEARYRRGIVQYCEKFTDEAKSMTIRTFDHIDAVFKLGLGIDKLQSVMPLSGSNSVVNEGKKRKIIQLEEVKDSFTIMDQYLKRFIESFKISQNSFQLTEEDLQVEKDLAEAFYGIQQQSRMKFLKKIPLGILYRLRECKRKITDNYMNIGQNVSTQLNEKKDKHESLQSSTINLFKVNEIRLNFKRNNLVINEYQQ